MPKSTYISISSHKGKKEFRITPDTRQKLYLAFALLALTIIIGTFFTNRHLDQLKQEVIASQKAIASTQKAFEKSQNDFHQSQEAVGEAISVQDQLTDALAEKERSLLEMDRRLEGLEILLGMQDEIEPGTNLYEQLDLVSMNTVTRNTLLTVIPNGVPMRYKRVSSPFGYRKHPITKKYAQHNGMDFTCDIGEKIYAPANGVIEATQKSSKGYGNLVRMSHVFGFRTYFAHLHRIHVKSGQFVNRGDLIGTCGNSGRSTGPHLHYEIRFLYRALNPQPFLTWNYKNFDSLFTKERHVNWKALVSMISNIMYIPVKQFANNVPVESQKSSAISNASESLETP